MIDEILLRVGQGEQLAFRPTRVNIVVGPNGAGKSLFLRELRACLATEQPSTQLIETLALSIPSDPAEFEPWLLERGFVHDEVSKLVHFPNLHPKKPRTIEFRREGGPTSVGLDPLSRIFDKRAVGRALTTFLDGKARLEIAEGGSYNSPAEIPDGCWSYLICEADDRECLQQIVAQDLGYHLYLDLNSRPGKATPRMSREPLPDYFDELSISTPLAECYSAMPRLSELSDGIQASVGMLIAALIGRWRQLIIDEPEAFLHPPLARALARSLARLAEESDHNLFVATHSAEFLMGCLEAGVEVTVLRLEYTSDLARAYLLPSTVLRELYLDPLLRSSRVLQGLFHGGVVVAEGEYDRAFYDEINRRLLDHTDAGCRDTLFVCAQGKNAIHRIAQPVRQSGVPAAVIVDLDILHSGWRRLLPALIPAPDERQPLEAQVEAIRPFLFVPREDQPTKFRQVELDTLAEQQREQLQTLLGALRVHGIFVVPGGALESWLTGLGVRPLKRNKAAWVMSIFEKLGSDPRAHGYVTPEDADVWVFVAGIGAWLAGVESDENDLVA